MSDTSTHVDAAALSAMAAKDADEPVVMLNLLRYRGQAEAGAGVDGLTGEQAYRHYGESFAALGPRFGGEVVWMGRAGATIIGAEGWDVAILVRYPHRRDFVAMMGDPDYLAIAPIRAASLADSRLIELTQLLPRPAGRS